MSIHNIKADWAIATADTIMARYPDPDDIPGNGFAYSVGYILYGIEKVWKYTWDIKYFNYIKKYVDQHVDESGNFKDLSFITGVETTLSGIIILAVYEQTALSKYKSAAEQIRKAFDSLPRNTEGGFWHAMSYSNEMWVDGVYTGQMFLIRYAKTIGDSVYCFDEAANQLIIMADHCQKSNGLLLHAWAEKKDKPWANPETGLSPEVWCEGLGWYSMILIETMGLMPSDHPQREQLLNIWNKLIAGLKNTQDPGTGLWFDIVDKGDEPGNWHDTSGSAMFVYSIQLAIESGLLDAAAYSQIVQKGYSGIVSKAVINSDGLVDIYDACDGVCVQVNYNDYVNYIRIVNAKECVAGFLLATGIVEKSKG